MISTNALKRLLPPIVLDIVHRARPGAITFGGDYATWNDALADSRGYDSGEILERIAEATRKVLRGEAVYERDSVLFDRVQYSFPLLATLLKAAVENQGRLCVLDVGGSLGTSYRECRSFLGDALALRWMIVEQQHFVEYGRQHLQTGELHFFASVSDAAAAARADVVLLSSVLQYLREPQALIDEVLRLEAPHVVVDRTIVNEGGADRLYVQRVPRSIYPASYPCWSLSERELLRKFSKSHELIADFASLAFPALRAIDSQFKGFLFRKRPPR